MRWRAAVHTRVADEPLPQRSEARQLWPRQAVELERLVPVRGLGRRSAALGGPLEGWRVASKRLGALPRIKRGALGRDCGREGSGALPLPRAAAASTGLRVLAMQRK